jgi:hypothetical protein
VNPPSVVLSRVLGAAEDESEDLTAAEKVKVEKVKVSGKAPG